MALSAAEKNKMASLNKKAGNRTITREEQTELNRLKAKERLPKKNTTRGNAKSDSNVRSSAKKTTQTTSGNLSLSQLRQLNKADLKKAEQRKLHNQRTKLEKQIKASKDNNEKKKLRELVSAINKLVKNPPKSTVAKVALNKVLLKFKNGKATIEQVDETVKLVICALSDTEINKMCSKAGVHMDTIQKSFF